MKSLLAPQWPPVSFEPVKFHTRGFFTHYPEQELGFGPKFRGTDGKPTNVAYRINLCEELAARDLANSSQ